ncbi:MAG: sulfatase-like hydrolase/transferase [Phycisphaerae bacterium]|nr:sulfatase-like hydrolase/transferase [Phycisphaerae bacterium]
MDRRQFLKISSASMAAMSLGGCAALGKAVSKKKPNIVFIFSDDHAVQTISAYGSKVNTTPNIDRIAKNGVALDRFFCCNSICAPSRAAILTGKHSHVNGQMTNGVVFDGEQVTMPKLMQKAGYQTALIGKWHLRSDPTGFDYWQILPGQGCYYSPDFISAEGQKRYEGYATDITTDFALQWMDKRDKNKPFMLMCQHKAPHRTWAPAIRHLHLYDDIDIPEPDNLFDDYSGRIDALKDNEMSIENHMVYGYDLKVEGCKIKDALGRNFGNGELSRMTPDQLKQWRAAYGPKNEKFMADYESGKLKGKDLVRWKYQRYAKDYLRTIKAVDENVGRVLDYLEENDLADNTIVIYSSDQGFYVGDHGWYDKRWMYEESFRMPFLIQWPGVTKAGKTISSLAQNIDFAPTFLDAAGAEIPDEIQGVSLRPILDGKAPKDWRKGLYYHYYERGEHHVPAHEGVRTDRYKLISFYDTNQWELFDLEKDPKEMKSVYNEKAYVPIRNMLLVELARLKKQYNVPENLNRRKPNVKQ